MEGTVSKYVNIGFVSGGSGGRFIKDGIGDILDENNLDMVGHYFVLEGGVVSCEGEF